MIPSSPITLPAPHHRRYRADGLSERGVYRQAAETAETAPAAAPTRAPGAAGPRTAARAAVPRTAARPAASAATGSPVRAAIAGSPVVAAGATMTARAGATFRLLVRVAAATPGRR